MTLKRNQNAAKAILDALLVVLGNLMRDLAPDRTSSCWTMEVSVRI